MRYLQNTIMILATTVLTAAAVYAGIAALATTATASGVASSVTDSDTTVQTCPRTGCSSAGCHATSGPGRGHSYPL